MKISGTVWCGPRSGKVADLPGFLNGVENYRKSFILEETMHFRSPHSDEDISKIQPARVTFP